ncbi:hypothetical protein U9R62_13710 [Cylindrospermopsis raciborskii DSH]|uniref:hypothetical protein n=1 Tax=Cylindrospermopsis raciborskii TaxID=77022 RepID=UPI002ED80C9A
MTRRNVGRPEQVELDIIIKNGLTIVCELKSSIDKAGMYVFGHEPNSTLKIKIEWLTVGDFSHGGRTSHTGSEILGIETYSYADMVVS